MSSKNLHRAFLLGLGLVICFSLEVRLCAQQTGPANPSFKLQGLDGRVYDLTDLRGNVLLVSFGATWCAPCTSELHSLEELLSEYKGKPVKFFWVSIEGTNEITNGDLRRYAKERQVTFPVLRDTGKMVFSQFSPRVHLPMIVFLGKDGHVENPQFGLLTPVSAYKANMRMKLNKLLAERTEADR